MRQKDNNLILTEQAPHSDENLRAELAEVRAALAAKDLELEALRGELHRREESVSKLIEREERYQLVLDSMPVLLAYLDADLTYQYCNTRYEDWFGLKLEQVLGRPMAEVIGPAAFEKARPRIKRVLSGESFRWEERMKYQHGPERHIQVEYVPHIVEGTVRGFFALVRDVSEQVTASLALEELRQNREQILASIADGFVCMDADLRYTFVNRAAEGLYSLKQEDMLGRKVEEVFPGIRGTAFHRAMQQVQAEKRTVRVEGFYPDHGRWYDCRYYPQEDGGVTGYISDSTEAQATRERLKLAVAAGDMGVWETDLLTETSSFDQRRAELFGFPEGTGKASVEELLRAIHPQDQEKVRAAYEAAISGEQDLYDAEFRVLTHGGEKCRWLAGKGITMRDAGGRAFCMIGLNFDITNRKLAEENLKEMNRILEDRVRDRTEELRILSDNVPAFFCYLDRNLQYRFMNPMYADCYQLDSPTAYIGRRFDESMTPAAAAELEPKLQAALKGDEQNFEVTLHLPGTAMRTVRKRYVPRVNGDEIDGVFVLANDITEERRLQQDVLHASEQEKERIGRDIHDSLCQELAGIGLLCRVLAITLRGRNVPEAADAFQLVQKINDANLHARQMARGLSPLAVEGRDLSHALTELAENVSHLYSDISCRFEASAESSGLNPEVATQLYFIAREAIYNAARHCGRGRVIVSLQKLDGEVHLTITDDGGGNAEHALAHEGLGLRSMRYRATTLGGYLEVRNNREKTGLTIRCRVPARS